MPQYEVVAHATYELDAATPEEAAAMLRRDLVGGVEDTVALRHLALWRVAAAGPPSPLTATLRRQLAEFFAGVGRSAAAADEVFRTQVAAILEIGPQGLTADQMDGRTEPAAPETAGMGAWETEGGRLSR